jgi:uncharacterized phage protein gp47/JayE
MAILIRSETQILNQMLDRIQGDGLLSDLAPGRSAFALAQTAAAEISDLYRSLNINTAQTYVTSARGAFLDLIADLFQIERRSAQPAVVLAEDRIIRFYVTTGTLAAVLPSKVIPTGTRIQTATGDVVFRTTTPAAFNDIATEVFVSAATTEVGSGQRVGVNELQTHNVGPADLLVNNTSAIANATDVEDDEPFRARVADAMLTRVSGNEASLREAGFIASGVSEVRIEPHVNGPGTVKMTIIPTTNQLAATTRAQVRANVELVRSAGTIVDVREPKFIPVEVVIVLKFRADANDSQKPTIRRRAVASILNYLDGLRLGQTFVLNELIQRVMDVSELIADMEIRCLAFRRRAQVLRNFIPDTDELFVPDPQLEEPIRVL